MRETVSAQGRSEGVILGKERAQAGLAGVSTDIA
jgi:hypothetical protein